MEQSKFNEAIEPFKKVLIKYKCWCPEGADIAQVYHLLGSVSCSLEKYSRAEEYLQIALTMFSKWLGDKDPSVANVYNNLGLVYKNINNVDKSLECFNNALEIANSQKPVDKHIKNLIKTNQSLAYASKGDIKKAETILLEVLREREQPGYELEKSDIYYNLGCLKQKSSDTFKDAEKYFKMALDLKNDIYKGYHFDIAMIYQNFGNLCLANNEIPGAISQFYKVVENFEFLFTKQNIFTSKFCLNVGNSLFEKKQFNEALDFYTIAANSRENISFKSKEKFSLETPEEIEKLENENQENLAEIANLQGKTLLQIHDKSNDAKLKLDYALKIFNGLKGEKDGKTKECLRLLSEAWSQLGNQDEAKKCRDKAGN
jgi:tetratricopeptide (TPR) repeat protein